MPYKNKEDQNECARAWRKRNPDYHSKYNREYVKNNPWVKHYFSIKSRLHKSHAHEKPTYKNRKFYLTLDLIKKLWFRDKAYDFRKPHLHRRDNDGHYSFENCEFLEGTIHLKNHFRKASNG